MCGPLPASSRRTGTVLGTSFMKSVGRDPRRHGHTRPGCCGLEGPQAHQCSMARESEDRTGLWAGGRHVNTTGAVGTNSTWWITFNPWGPSCWAAQPGSCHSATPTTVAPPGTWVGQRHFPVASCFLPVSGRQRTQHQGRPILGV